MKLADYIKALQAIKKQHGNLDCFYSCDDEGNGYNEIVYSPSVHNTQTLGVNQQWNNGKLTTLPPKNVVVVN